MAGAIIIGYGAKERTFFAGEFVIADDGSSIFTRDSEG
jgi:hypothetical protein